MAINQNEFYIEVLQTLILPCIVVVGTRLGGINHTLLTLAALQSRGINILGIIPWYGTRFNLDFFIDEKKGIKNSRIKSYAR